MVCKESSRFRRQESMKKQQQHESDLVRGKEAARQEMVRLQCNKGKACKFKRSCFSEEEDATTSAILLLACVVCAPSSI